jgi:hypothetical protein
MRALTVARVRSASSTTSKTNQYGKTKQFDTFLRIFIDGICHKI